MSEADATIRLMATGNGKGSWMPEVLAELQALRSSLLAHTESTSARFEAQAQAFEALVRELRAQTEAYVRETRERFAGMDQNLVRIAHILTGVGERLEDHETRLSRLEGH